MKFKEVFNHTTGAAVLLLLGIFLAISPAGERKAVHLNPDELAATIISKSNFVTAEDVAAWIIDKKPDLLVVDIRSSEEYQQYHIPGAINIPLAKLFEPESLELLGEDYIIVLYSNGGTYAAQAWVMLKQMGYETYVLLGGLNYWVEAIVNPQPPNDLAADSEILRYHFRQSASQYFNQGGVAISRDAAKNEQTRTVPKIKRRRKIVADEGC